DSTTIGRWDNRHRMRLRESHVLRCRPGRSARPARGKASWRIQPRWPAPGIIRPAAEPNAAGGVPMRSADDRALLKRPLKSRIGELVIVIVVVVLVVGATGFYQEQIVAFVAQQGWAPGVPAETVRRFVELAAQPGGGQAAAD